MQLVLALGDSVIQLLMALLLAPMMLGLLLAVNQFEMWMDRRASAVSATEVVDEPALDTATISRAA